MNRQSNKTERPAHGALVRKLVLLSVAMFGFGFALWPLYNVFCDLTGLGGRGVQIAEDSSGVAQSDRSVRLRFDATVNSALDWEFAPCTDGNRPTVELEMALDTENATEFAVWPSNTKTRVLPELILKSVSNSKTTSPLPRLSLITKVSPS